MAFSFSDQFTGQDSPTKIEDFKADLLAKSDQAFYRLALTQNFYRPGITATSGGDQGLTAGVIAGTTAGTTIGGSVPPTLNGRTLLERALQLIFKNEGGGLTVDVGGPTVWGITWKDDYNPYHAELGLPFISLAEAHIKGGIYEKTVTLDVAARIYELHYWPQHYSEALAAQGLPKSAFIAFDNGINSGRANIIFRQVMNLPVNCSGQQVLAAISSLSPAQDLSLANRLNEAMEAYRQSLGGKYKQYHRGWHNRYIHNIENIRNFQ